MNQFDSNNTYSGDVVSNLPGNSYGLMSLNTSRQGRAIMQHARLEAGQMYCRAAVAETALNCVGALSMVEGVLAQKAPWGQERYKAIVDACAYKMVQQISQF